MGGLSGQVSGRVAITSQPAIRLETMRGRSARSSASWARLGGTLSGE